MNLSRVSKVYTAPGHWLQWEETELRKLSPVRNVKGWRISSRRILIDPWRTRQVERS